MRLFTKLNKNTSIDPFHVLDKNNKKAPAPSSSLPIITGKLVRRLGSNQPSKASLVVVALISGIVGGYFIYQSFAAVTVTNINNSSVGTGTNQFEFVGGTWIAAGESSAYGGDQHYTNTTGAYYQVRFNGTQAKIYTIKSPDSGIAGVSIDGGPEKMIDHYASTRTGSVMVYDSTVENGNTPLTNSLHTLKVRVTGNKNTASTAAYIVADRVEVTSTDTTTSPTSTGWELVYQDDFNTLNTSSTSPHSWSLYSGPGHAGNGLRSPSAISVVNGVLNITAKPVLQPDGTTKTVSGGMANRTNMTYGKYETRVKTAADPSGFISGVILTWPQTGTNWANGENDFYETGTKAGIRNPFYSYIHYPDTPENTSPTPQTQFVHNADASQWHKVVMEWKAEYINIKVYRDENPADPNDDILVSDKTLLESTDPARNNIPDVPHHATIQLDAFSQALLSQEVKMEVDYMKFYKASTTPPPSAELNLKLVNADTDQAITTMTNGMTIDLATARNLSIDASASVAIESIRFDYDNQIGYKVESAAPYAIAGDNGSTDYYPWTPTVGTHNLTVKAFSSDGAVGTELATTTISFTVVDTSTSTSTDCAGGPAAFPSRLKAEGRNLVDENGCVVPKLKGFNMHVGPGFTWPQANFDEIAAKGGKINRAVLHWDQFEPQQGVIADLTNLTQHIQRAQQAGMYTMLELHLNVGRLPSWMPAGTKETEAYGVYGQRLTQALAARYATDKSVLGFGLNEPPLQDDSIRNGNNSIPWLEEKQRQMISWMRGTGGNATDWIGFVAVGYAGATPIYDDTWQNANAIDASPTAYNSVGGNVVMDVHNYMMGCEVTSSDPANTTLSTDPNCDGRQWNGMNYPTYQGNGTGPQIGTDSTIHAYSSTTATRGQLAAFMKPYKNFTTQASIPLMLGEWGWSSRAIGGATSENAWITDQNAVWADAGTIIEIHWNYDTSSTKTEWSAKINDTTWRPSVNSWLSSTTPPTDTTPPTLNFQGITNGAIVGGSQVNVSATAYDPPSTTDGSGINNTEGVKFYLKPGSMPSTDPADLKMTDNASPYQYSFNSTALANGTYTLTVTAKDMSTNANLAVKSVTFTVNNVDTAAPNPPANLCGTTTQPTTSTPGKIVLGWPAATDNGSPASGIKHYLVQRNGQTIATVSTATSTTCNGTSYQYSYTDNNVPVGNHSYVIRSVDNADLTSVAASPPFTDTIVSPPDSQNPTAPTNLTAIAASSSQINLSWTASTDDIGVVGYNVYRGLSPDAINTKINTNLVTGTSLGDNSGLTPGTTYYYQVEAVDGVGKVSPRSLVKDARTLDVDTAPPVVTITAPTNGSTVSGHVTISARAADNTVVSRMEVYVDNQLYATSTSGNISTNWNTNPSRWKGPHTITVKARDTSGNIGTSTSTVTVR